ncbi:MAG: hypothetical protein J2P48_11715 [Alphaproteobacteria bacterium]|nr:hypothetical protein [Alphaproteobacteria bacterium]
MLSSRFTAHDPKPTSGRARLREKRLGRKGRQSLLSDVALFPLRYGYLLDRK